MKYHKHVFIQKLKYEGYSRNQIKKILKIYNDHKRRLGWPRERIKEKAVEVKEGVTNEAVCS